MYSLSLKKQKISQFFSAFPAIVNIEVYRGQCPCRCKHCPVGVTPVRKRTHVFKEKGMTTDLFRKIAREVSMHPSATLRLHSVGEPLLWNNLKDSLDILNDLGSRTWIFTSAVTSDTRLLKMLCQAVNILEVSVNSINDDDYQETKGIDAFENVVRNIEYMSRFILKHKLPTRLIVSRVESVWPQKDAEFVRFWKETGLVQDAFVRSYHSYNNILPALCHHDNGHARQPCLVHWTRFNINVEGKAVICFNDLFKSSIADSLIIGDINTQDIFQVWNGDKLRHLREADLTGDYSSLSFAKDLSCSNCSYRQPLFGNHQRSEYQVAQLG